MEQKSVAQLKAHAKVTPFGVRPMSRHERLTRWEGLLLREPERRLRTLSQVEFMASSNRRSLRLDGSPLALAFSDWVLRQEGLAGDSYGDIVDFFDLSEHQAHLLVCDCMHGVAVSAARIAHHIGWIKQETAFRRICRHIWDSPTLGTVRRLLRA